MFFNVLHRNPTREPVGAYHVTVDGRITSDSDGRTVFTYPDAVKFSDMLAVSGETDVIRVS